MNRKLLAVAVAGAVVPMVAQALDVSVSGRVNRIVRFADNGAGSDVQHLNGPSGSRFTFAAEGEVMEGLIFGANQDVGWASNSSRSVEALDKPGEGAGFRRSYLYFGGDFGTVTMGHATEAGNGAMFAPYNDAWAGVEYTADANSAITVRTTDEDMVVCTAGTPATTTLDHSAADDGGMMGMTGKEETETPMVPGHTHVAAVADTYCSVGSFLPSVNNGISNVLRYDSPSIGPVSFSISTNKEDATDHTWSFGANLSHDVGGTGVKAAMSYRDDVFGIAGGLKFAQGTSVNAGWGMDDSGKKDYEDMYVQLGHTWGAMAVALQYRTTDDSNTDMEGRSIGLGANYELGSGVSVFAGFNNYSFDKPGYNIEDVNSFHIGSQVLF